MKLSTTQVDILYGIIAKSDLLSPVYGRISGDVYKFKHSYSGTVEDIVINSISLVGQSNQFGTAVVNIYVPDIEFKGQSQPNNERISNLAAKVIELIKSAETADYNMTIDSQDLQDNPEDLRYHFYSIKVNFEFFNT